MDLVLGVLSQCRNVRLGSIFSQSNGGISKRSQLDTRSNHATTTMKKRERINNVILVKTGKQNGENINSSG